MIISEARPVAGSQAEFTARRLGGRSAASAPTTFQCCHTLTERMSIVPAQPSPPLGRW